MCRRKKMVIKMLPDNRISLMGCNGFRVNDAVSAAFAIFDTILDRNDLGADYYAEIKD